MTKVSELTGRLLDEWVARAEGHRVARYKSDGGPDILAVTSKDDGRTRIIDGGTTFEWIRSGVYHPSTDAKDGQPIMERLRISVWDNGALHEPNPLQWIAGVHPEGDDAANDLGIYALWMMGGATQLIAGMRTRVAMVYGDEVPA